MGASPICDGRRWDEMNRKERMERFKHGIDEVEEFIEESNKKSLEKYGDEGQSFFLDFASRFP
jgi:hypothetical protein